MDTTSQQVLPDHRQNISRSSSKYFSATGKIFPYHYQNISRASSEYFQIDDDLISTDFLIAVNSPVSRCSKFEANPFGMWDVIIIFSATIVIFAFVTTISTITYKEDPPPIFYQKVTQQISNFTAVVFLGRKAFPAWLLLDCEDVGKYQSTRKTIFECLFGCRKLLEPIAQLTDSRKPEEKNALMTSRDECGGFSESWPPPPPPLALNESLCRWMTEDICLR